MTADLIASALATAPDFSPPFTSRVAALTVAIRESCGTAVEHDSSMSYAASQSISWDEEQGGRTFKFRIFLSARGPLYALTAYRMEKPREWRREVDAPASTDFACIRSILDGQGLTFLAATDLEGLAPGFVTEMDGVPASLFEVLFSEVA
jgi:hypothetical protein